MSWPSETTSPEFWVETLWKFCNFIYGELQAQSLGSNLLDLHSGPALLERNRLQTHT